eukprot:Hpha_TRINITY_DN16840_c4_g5::TRINITY_DN16840_c4_g5_i2::g.152459::m.152459
MDEPDASGGLAHGRLDYLDALPRLPNNNSPPDQVFVPNLVLVKLVQRRNASTVIHCMPDVPITIPYLHNRGAVAIATLPFNTLGRYLVPQGGTGSKLNPFRGLHVAILSARVGDMVVCSAGEYLPVGVEGVSGPIEVVTQGGIIEPRPGFPAIGLLRCRQLVFRGWEVRGGGWDSRQAFSCGITGSEFKGKEGVWHVHPGTSEQGVAMIRAQNKCTRDGDEGIAWEWVLVAYAVAVVLTVGSAVLTLMIGGGYSEAEAVEWSVRALLVIVLDALLWRPLLLVLSWQCSAGGYTKPKWDNFDPKPVAFSKAALASV